MRIKRIFVNGLFNMFDHEIPLNMGERITIIHGQNGLGKTAILRLIDGLFNSRYTELFSYPFETFGVDFDDGKTLRVSKQIIRHPASTDSDSKVRRVLVFKYDKQQYEFTLGGNSEEFAFSVSAIEELAPFLDRVGQRHWRTPEGEILDADEVSVRFGVPFRASIARKEPTWLQSLKAAIDVRIIPTDRLISSMRVRRTPRAEKTRTDVAAVRTYSEQLAADMQVALARYAETSQSLDRTFPSRLLTQQTRADFTPEQIQDRLRGFEKQRSRLMGIGLLDQDQQSFLTVTEIDSSTLKALAIYAEDVKHKLEVFNTLASKIELFMSVINRRFKYKKMKVSREFGITFITDAGEPLSPDKLSSGEQHEVVLLYELLFKVRENSLVLIDEPEISLHVAWQQEFLDDLQEMTNLSGFDVLVATHSPQLIGERWNLTVPLADNMRAKSNA